MKRKIPHILILLAIILNSSGVFAQKNVADSLVRVLNNATTDTARLRIYTALFDACDVNDNLKYGQPAIELADNLLAQITNEKERKILLKEKASFLYDIALYYISKKQNIKALEYLDQRLKAAEKIGNKDDIAAVNRSIGRAYLSSNIYSKALEYNLKALSTFQEMRDTDNMVQCIEFIGIIYKNQNNTAMALQYALKAFGIAKRTKNYENIANCYKLVCHNYSDLHDTAKFHDYALQLLEIEKNRGNKRGMAEVFLGLGEGYIDNDDYVIALANIQKSLELWTELNSKENIAYCLGRIAKIYRKQKDYPNALEYFFKALAANHSLGGSNTFYNYYTYLRIGQMYEYQLNNYKMAKCYLDSALTGMINFGRLDYLAESYNSLADLDSLTGDYKAEVKDYKKYIRYNDSLQKTMTSQQTIQVETNYELNQLDAKDKAEQAQKDILAAADKRRETIIIWSVIGGLLLVLVFAGFVFRSLRITRRQKQNIEVKNKVIEEKNKNILDSITYAKRLQDAILPPLSLIKKYLPESFVLYLPKDIVAGDFYWMERTGDTILIAAADCTGHGVPGALVSVVCSNALNRTVKEFHITEPGKILDKVRELVLETFEKSESNVQDGMDISLCCINTNTKEIQWSGAYNSLWYIHLGEMKELPADKQPIGKLDKPLPFNTHNLNLQKGDTLYLFTDGYADQFGGPKGKKFKYRQLQDALTANATSPMDEQKSKLEDILDSWKGSLEQVDDILVIGIKV